jgi:hypothetical protein
VKTISIKQLSEDVRELLSDAEQSGGLVVEDENGRPRSRIYAYAQPTEAQRQEAWERMRGFEKNVQLSFDEQGVNEDDLSIVSFRKNCNT